LTIVNSIGAVITTSEGACTPTVRRGAE